MKLSKIIVLCSMIFILILTIGAGYAISDSNNDALSSGAIGDNIEMLGISDNVVLNDSPKTIVVPFDPENPNEVLSPNIQPALDNANSGDTVIIEGSPAHCHITINKTLNVVAGDGATIDPCPHFTHEGLGSHGVFYVTEHGSGSIIQGFTFLNRFRSESPFFILIDGASDVTVKNCVMDYMADDDERFVGIIINNSDNVKLSNLLIRNAINGITIINSTNVHIDNCNVSDNVNNAICVFGNSKNIDIFNNSIVNNGNSGITLLSANNISILNNLIKDNGFLNSDSGSGIYVNTNITKLIVKGNIFLKNNLHAIMYDYRTRNLNNDYGADKLTDVDNNYFQGHSSMILHHRTYVENDGGTVKYDVENDVYGDMGEGHYVDVSYYVYMKRAFIVNDIPCGFTYYTPTMQWSKKTGGEYDLYLKLSDIVQIKNGVYQISIVDADGNVATDFNSIYITFFLNEHNTVAPQQGDVYKKVLVQNGVAVADFRDVYSSFKTSNNTITAVFHGLSTYVKNNPNQQFKVDNQNIPIDPSTSLISSKLTTYPLSEDYITVRLVDSNNKGISKQYVVFKFNGEKYIVKTDNKGFAKVKVSLISKKTYAVKINYWGNDDYKSSKATSKIFVKTGFKKSKITASNIKIKKNKKKTFMLTLTGSYGKKLSYQKVVVKVDGKYYVLKTNKKGVAKLSFKFSKVKKYKIKMSYLGNWKYKPVTLIKTISVTKK